MRTFKNIMAWTLRRDHSAVHHTRQSDSIVRLGTRSTKQKYGKQQSTHNVNELLYLSFPLRPDLPHLERNERTKCISLGGSAYIRVRTVLR